MRHNETCPCCGDRASKSFWAIIAPFIADYIHPINDSLITSLHQCLTCDHRFFVDQYDDNEMASLYSEYRSAAYLSTRRKSEPWYTAKLNSANLDPLMIAQRKQGLTRFLSTFLTSDSRQLIVADIGGDAGQFIPLALARQAYVVEASAQTPVSGVSRVGSIDDIPSPVDLVICAHVLEHLPSPVEFMSDLAASGNLSKDCLFYIEVPLERYHISPLLQSRLYCRYLHVLLLSRWLTICLDFLSVVARSKAGMIFPPLLIKLHEHVNFFTSRSLAKLMTSSGLEMVGLREEKSSNLRTHQGVIRALARKAAVTTVAG
jgi:hypothetical protein